MKNKTNQAELKSKTLILSIILVFVIGAGVGYVCYRSGVERGKALRNQEIEAELSELGTAISEKNAINEKIDEVFDDSLTTFTAGNIEEYKNKILGLKLENMDKTVAEKIDEVAGKIDEFKQTYESRENDVIDEKFGELKETVTKMSSEITELYNQKIRSGAESLLSK